MEKIHIRLRAELDRLGLSQAEAARQMGEETAQGVVDVVNARKKLTAEFLAKFAPLGVNLNYVLFGDSQPKVADKIPVYLSDRDAKFLDNYQHCSRDAQQALYETSAALAKFDEKENDGTGG